MTMVLLSLLDELTILNGMVHAMLSLFFMKSEKNMRIVNSNVIDDVSEAVERGILGLRFLGNECLRDVICVYIVEDIEGCFLSVRLQ